MNGASKDNAGYCVDDRNNAVNTLPDGVDRDRSTSTAGDVSALSLDSVRSEAVDKSGYRRGSVRDILANGGVQQEAVDKHGRRRSSSRSVVATDAVEHGSYHTMRSVILILALSLHHLFEGISLGLQRTVTGALMLLIALLCHETIISFSLGLQFVKCAYTTRQHYVTAFACSIIEPIGVAVGT